MKEILLKNRRLNPDTSERHLSGVELAGFEWRRKDKHWKMEKGEMSTSILIVDDEPQVFHSCKKQLGRSGELEIHTAEYRKCQPNNPPDDHFFHVWSQALEDGDVPIISLGKIQCR